MSTVQIYDLYAQKIADITNVPYPYIVILRQEFIEFKGSKRQTNPARLLEIGKNKQVYT